MNENASLSHALGALVPGKPVEHGRLKLLPLICTRPGTIRYVLLATALERDRLTVTEVSEGGAVPYLKAVNQGPWPVLIFDGEELVGAKQNRIVNTTILVGVGESVLPVSCVEQGRWSARSRAFAAGKWASHPRLRREKEQQVRSALAAAPKDARHQSERAACYRSDQGAVWHEVARQSDDLGIHSSTGAMADAYAERAGDLDELLAAFSADEGDVPAKDMVGAAMPAKDMVGAAVFLDEEFLCLDTLWSVRRFRELYPKLLRGYALEALQAPPKGQRKGAEAADPEAEVLRLFAELTAAELLEREGVDLGTDVRAETRTAFAAGLALEDELLQLSVFPR